MTQHQHNGWDDKMADWYVEQWGEHAIHDDVMSLPLLTELSDASVIDIGCGSGPMVRRIATKLKNGAVYGIDPTAKMIEHAKAKTPDFSHVKVEFIQTGAARLPFDACCIDVVLALNSLHHWPDVAQGLEEIYRVMRQGASLLIVDEIFDETVELHKPNEQLEQDLEAHIHAYKQPENIITALKQAGFAEITHQVFKQTTLGLHVISATRGETH